MPSSAPIQLGARQGAGAVYLHAHHPIFCVSRYQTRKRRRKIRIKTLSLA
jgi:ribonucleoside-diphosphate reductase alpha chain